MSKINDTAQRLKRVRMACSKFQVKLYGKGSTFSPNFKMQSNREEMARGGVLNEGKI